MQRFVNPLSDFSKHPIVSTFRFVDLAEYALDNKIPMISIDTGKPLDAANRVFVEDIRKKREHINRTFREVNNHKIYYLEGLEPDFEKEEQEVLLCTRFNFDMNLTTIRWSDLE